MLPTRSTSATPISLSNWIEWTPCDMCLQKDRMRAPRFKITRIYTNFLINPMTTEFPVSSTIPSQNTRSLGRLVDPVLYTAAYLSDLTVGGHVYWHKSCLIHEVYVVDWIKVYETWFWECTLPYVDAIDVEAESPCCDGSCEDMGCSGFPFCERSQHHAKGAG